MDVYQQKIMRDHRHNSGSYHVFSLIGFMLRANYSRWEGAELTEIEVQRTKEFEDRIEKFVGRYKEFCKKYVKHDSVTLYKYQDIPQIYQDAR
jgi:hypothetical protein